MKRDEMTTERRRSELADRLDGIERAAEQKALPRGAAADLVRDEVIVPAGTPQTARAAGFARVSPNSSNTSGRA